MPLDDLAALARALDNKVVICREILARDADDNWVVVARLKRVVFVESTPPIQKEKNT